jgi:hypothetical protein
MTVGREDHSSYTMNVTGAGTHTAGTWPVDLDVEAIGLITAKVVAYVDGNPDEGFVVELKAGYRVSAGALSLGPVATPLPLVTFGSTAGVAADLDVDGANMVLLVDGLAGITFDVDTRWDAWSTA